jgi:hypothetical protein
VARYAIDRFEDGWTILEDEAAQTFRVPRAWVPTAAREGDIVRVALRADAPSEAVLNITLDNEATEKRRRESDEQRQRLPSGPKGDISL